MHSRGTMLGVEHAPVADHCRNGVLENQLLLRARFDNQRELIETFYPAQELGAVDQINSYGGLFSAGEIEKSVLNILWRRFWIHYSDCSTCVAEILSCARV